jgi:hypothetical protein
MILGKLASMGINVAKRAAKPAFNKAISKFQQVDSALVRKVNNKIMPKPALTRDMSVSAKVKAVDAAANSSRNVAKAIVRSSYVAAPAYVAFEATGGARNTKPQKPASKPKPYDRKIGPAPTTPTAPTAKKNPVKKPVKKAAKRMTSVPTVRNRRTPTTGPKTQVEVGSSIIRDRKGAIKKVNAPTGKKPTSKYARMNTAQINRLGGMERRKYKKWKASQSK